MRLSVNCLAILLLLAPLAANAQKAEDVFKQEGLERFDRAKADLAYVRPGADWKKFKTIYLMPLNVPDEVRDAAPSGSRSDTHLGETFVLRDKDVQEIKDRFDKVMRREITKDGRFALVDNPQTDSLIVATRLLDITLKAPIEETRQTYKAARGATFSQGGGAVTIMAAYADGATGDVVARVIDHKVSPDIWRQNTEVANLMDLERFYGEWGRALCKRLAQIQSGELTLP